MLVLKDKETNGLFLYYISKNYPQYGSEFAIYTTKEAAERRSKELDEVYSDCFGDNQVNDNLITKIKLKYTICKQQVVFFYAIL